MPSLGHAVVSLPPERAIPEPKELMELVRKTARQIARRLPSHVERDELVAAGLLGLAEAMNKYDESAGHSFEGYARLRIRGAILDELRSRDLMARDARAESKRLIAAIESIERDLQRKPTEEEIASALGLSLDEYRERLSKLAPVRVMSLEHLNSDQGVLEVGAVALDALEKKQLLQRLVGSIRKLSERQQQVVQLYYHEELTLKAIGEVLGVTESRVCQILSEATHRLRAELGVKNAKRKSRHG